jgi:hypothetical protein
MGKTHRDPFEESHHTGHDLACVAVAVLCALAISVYAVFFWTPNAMWKDNLLVRMMVQAHQTFVPGAK